jgi:hypothetical protein
MNLEETILLCHEKQKPNVQNERLNEENTSAEKIGKRAVFFIFHSTEFKNIYTVGTTILELC